MIEKGHPFGILKSAFVRVSVRVRTYNIHSLVYSLLDNTNRFSEMYSEAHLAILLVTYVRSVLGRLTEESII
jgi:hypothetical protein